MISPHTSPGTRVVCIDVRGSDLLVLNAEYTVTSIELSSSRPGQFCAYLAEIPRDRNGFGVRFFTFHFRRADLPSCLTELLKPVHIPREELV